MANARKSQELDGLLALAVSGIRVYMAVYKSGAQLLWNSIHCMAKKLDGHALPEFVEVVAVRGNKVALHLKSPLSSCFSIQCAVTSGFVVWRTGWIC